MNKMRIARVFILPFIFLIITLFTTCKKADTKDTTAPVITINGTNPVNACVGFAYEDAGATATDDVDGDITANIQTTNTVDTTAIGMYTVTYSVSDQAGNSAQAVRTVNVIYCK